MGTVPKVLCVTEFYLPGYKAGGPIRTIANMNELVRDKVDFAIITRDRDLGDLIPYKNVRVDDWQMVDTAAVYYASPESFGPPAIQKTLSDHDVLYLNSFFSFRGSIAPYLRFRNRTNILIAPRGEFSRGALALKSLKKNVFLGLLKLFVLYRDVHWHASTAMEAEDIERVFPHAKGRIHLAIDPVVLGPAPPSPEIPERTGELSLAFVSRISPMKNLDGLLRILSEIDFDAVLTIYGPVEDAQYWERCQFLIARLPANIRVVYAGALKADDVSAAFSKHDLFAFPTHGENFGHVIFEALRAGTAVVLSDQTPWQADPSGAVTIIPLDAVDVWRGALKAAATRTTDERKRLRAATLDYARRHVNEGRAGDDSVRMFEAVANATR